jgi:predicted aspartyl protease
MPHGPESQGIGAHELERSTMGKVVERLKLTSFPDPKRSIVVDAVVDAGATMIVLPMAVVRKLRLRKSNQVGVRYANGRVETKGVYGVVTAELRGRSGHFDVLAEENGTQPLIGQIMLEQLDLMVDPKRRCVAPNPQSPDLPMVEVLGLQS